MAWGGNFPWNKTFQPEKILESSHLNFPLFWKFWVFVKNTKSKLARFARIFSYKLARFARIITFYIAWELSTFSTFFPEKVESMKTFRKVPPMPLPSAWKHTVMLHVE